MGSSEPRFIIDHLVLDSLLFLRVLPPSIRSLVDIGSGAGLPGIPLKIVKPELELTLIESRRKRASFLSTAIRELTMSDTEVVHERAEDAAERYSGRFDAATMRSVGRLDQVAPTAAKLVKPGGMVVLSGPPTPVGTRYGRWVTVDGLRAGSSRHFLVYQPS